MPVLLFCLISMLVTMFIITVVLWTSSHILYGLLLHQKDDVRLLANKGLAIYVVYLNRYFVIPP